MITPVILPQLGDTMNEGTITRWLKREGDPVERDEDVVVIETDKATMEISAPASGTLALQLLSASGCGTGSSTLTWNATKQ